MANRLGAALLSDAVKQIGGKGQAGVFQRIINLIPWHRVYIEPFFGSGAVMRKKDPAEVSIGLDRITPKVTLPPGTRFIKADGIEFLQNWKFQGDEFVYCDPPYLLSTRGGRRYYQHELSDADHRRLLAVILGIKARVMISGYPSEMYAHALRGWRRESFQVMTRGHTWATEVLWYNYPAPTLPVDVKYFGTGYRDRLRLKRKMARWLARLGRLPVSEREFLISGLLKLRSGSGSVVSGVAGLDRNLDGGRALQ